MKAETFKRFDPWAKQKIIAQFFVARLKSVEQVEHPCLDYASALALAQLVSQYDTERLVQCIEVHSHFVRLIRNKKGSFAFAPVIIDYTERRLSVSDG